MKNLVVPPSAKKKKVKKKMYDIVIKNAKKMQVRRIKKV